MSCSTVGDFLRHAQGARQFLHAHGANLARAVVVPALLAYAAAVLFWTCVVFMGLGGLSLVAHLVDPGVRRSQFGGQSARLGIALGLVAAAVMYFTR